MPSITVDFISDMVCPWCFIGFTRLERALAASSADAEIRIHPYLLDPSMPPEGLDLRERLRAKFGADPETMFGRVEQAARESGIPLDFTKVRRFPNTLKAHTLVGAADSKGTARALVRALFAAYFLEEKDIGDDETLIDIAVAHGFTRDEAKEVLADKEALAATRSEAIDLSQQGIGGVPMTIFGSKLGVSGAQPVDVFRQAIERARVS